MLDFPNNPVDGEEFLSEGVQWVWDGTTMCWRIANTGNSVEIVDSSYAALGGQYVIMGDMLIQFGLIDNSLPDGRITFPIAFADDEQPPAVSITAAGQGTDGQRSVNIANTDNAGTDFFRYENGSRSSPYDCVYHVVGKCPPDMALAKQVTGAGGEQSEVDIVEADADAGWQVWGDTLIQWGAGTSNAGTGDFAVTYPIPFKNPPHSVASCGGGANPHFIHIVNATETTAGITWRVINDANGLGAGQAVRWISIGEAPDDMKQPKTVQTLGGSELQEYHDPSGVASWSIVGNKLECWGRFDVTATGGQAINFPKTFAREPIVTTNNNGTTIPVVTNTTNATASSITVRRWRLDTNAELNNGSVYWHAVGEWDGVS